MGENEHDRPMFRVEQIDHVELFVPDRRIAAEWYRHVLGLTVCPDHEHWADDPKGPLMISSDGGSTKLALFEGRPQEDRETAGFHVVAFRVSGRSFEAFLDRLDDLTLTDHEDRTVTREAATDHGHAFSLYFNDPYGHRLELTTYEVEGLRLLPLGVPRERVEIESIEAANDERLPVSGDERDVLWMCHGCSAQFPAKAGFVCSRCYRSTCTGCLSSVPGEEPVCKSCM